MLACTCDETSVSSENRRMAANIWKMYNTVDTITAATTSVTVINGVLSLGFSSVNPVSVQFYIASFGHVFFNHRTNN